jgi:ADP-ribose pyrophosphatase YjhB (NUDIX family)
MRQPRVGCGVAVIRDGRVLLLKRLKAPEAGCWGLPGGKVDWMEPAMAAAARELAEETGLTAGPLTLLTAADHIDPEGGEHWVAPTYLAREALGEAALLEPAKHAELGWFDPADPPRPLTLTALAALGVLVS